MQNDYSFMCKIAVRAHKYGMSLNFDNHGREILRFMIISKAMMKKLNCSNNYFAIKNMRKNMELTIN